MSLHQLVCGRHRKNIKLIESSTGTAIYFPPLFSQMYRFCPPNATRRDPTDIFITGESHQAIEMAKQKLHETVSRIRLYVKDVTIPAAKIDSILLGRLDKVRKILEANGTYIMFPPLACQRTMVRVQGSEGLPVERTVREIMSLVRISKPHLNQAVKLTLCRLVNFMALDGIFNNRRTDNFLARQTSALFSAIFVPTRTPICPLTKCPSRSLDQMMLSSLLWQLLPTLVLWLSPSARSGSRSNSPMSTRSLSAARRTGRLTRSWVKVSSQFYTFLLHVFIANYCLF